MISVRCRKYSILLLIISVTYHFANGMSGQKELQKKLGSLKGSLTALKSKLTLVQGKLESLQSKLAQPVGHAAPPPPPPMPDFGSKKPGVPDSGHTKEKKHVDLMAHIRGEGGTGTPKLKPVSKSGVTKAPAGLRDLFKQRSETVREALTLADDDFNSRIVDVSKLGTLDGTVQELVVLMDSADSQERLKKFVDVFIKIVKKENFFKLEQEFGEEDEALNLRGYLISEKLDEIIEFIKKIVEFFPDEKNGLLAGIKILEKYKVDYSEHIEKGRKAAELQREAKEQSDQKRAEEQRIVAVEKERIQKAIEPAKNLIVPHQVQAVGKDGKPVISSTTRQPMYIDDPQFHDFTKRNDCGASLAGAFDEIKEFIKKAATVQDVKIINEKIDEAKETFEGKAVQKAVNDSVKPLIRAFFAAWDVSYKELMKSDAVPAKEQKKTEPDKKPADKPVPPVRPARPAKKVDAQAELKQKEEAARLAQEKAAEEQRKAKEEAELKEAQARKDLLEKIDALIKKIDQTPKPEKESKLKADTLEKVIFEIFKKIKVGQILDDSALLKKWIINPKISEAINNLAGHEKTLGKLKSSLAKYKETLQEQPSAAAAPGKPKDVLPVVHPQVAEEETELSKSRRKVLKIKTPEEYAEALRSWILVIRPIPQIEESVLREVLKKLNSKDLSDLKQRVSTRKSSGSKKQAYEAGMFSIIEEFKN